MKKIKIVSFFSLVLALLVPIAVNATTNVVEVNSAASLTTCVGTTGNTCKVTGKITLDAALDITKDIIVDLNGNTIEASERLKTSNNKVDYTGMIIVRNGGKLTVNDATGKGKIIGGFAGLQVTKSGDAPTNVATLIVNNGTIEGTYYGISGNGDRPNTNVTINGGTIKGLVVDDSTGIYNPQDGELIIKGGTISGSTGIEVRAGSLKVSGGTITGTYKPLSVTPNGNGTTVLGAGIAVVQHTTKLDLNVEISGGTIKGFTPLHEENAQDNDAASIAKVTLDVTGGTFETINEGTLSIYSEDVTGFVSGGTFDKTLLATYLAENNVIKTINNKYKVGVEHNISVTTATNGTVTANKVKAIEGEIVTITTTPSEDYELKSLEVKKGTNVVTVTNKTFVMPNGNVTITATFSKITAVADVPVLEPTATVTKPTVGVKEESNVQDVLLDSLTKDTSLASVVNDQSVTVGIEVDTIEEEDLSATVVEAIKDKVEKGVIATYFDISVLVKNSNTQQTVGELTELSSEIELMILLPDNLKNTDKDINRKYFVVREHEGVVSLIEAKISADGKYLLFKSDVFSVYALGYADVAATNPKTVDNIYIYTLIALLSVAGLVKASTWIKKENN